jgi:hypothetical protein
MTAASSTRKGAAHIITDINFLKNIVFLKISAQLVCLHGRCRSKFRFSADTQAALKFQNKQ